MNSGNQGANARLLRDVAERLNVSASLIYQLVESGERHSDSIVRKCGSRDVCKESTRFGGDDLPLVAKTADLAHSLICRESAGQKVDLQHQMRRVTSQAAFMESTFHQLFERTRS